MKKVAVIGFSVSAGRQNFVFDAQEMLGDQVQLSRVALGGWNPIDLAYLLEYLLEQLRPDIVVFEIATSGYGSRPRDSAIGTAIRWLAHCCYERGILYAFMNCPRKDTELKGGNWIANEINAFAKSHNAPLRDLVLVEHSISDDVHLTGRGRKQYANALAKFLPHLLNCPFKRLKQPEDPDTRFRFLPIDECTSLQAGFDHDHQGFACRFAELHPGEEIEIAAPGQLRIDALFALTHRRAGEVIIQSVANAQSATLSVYGARSYYQRPLSLRSIARVRERTVVTIKQSPDLPTIVLHKGEPDMSPRVSRLFGIGVKSAWQYDTPLAKFRDLAISQTTRPE